VEQNLNQKLCLGLLVAIILLAWGLALVRLGERSLWADEGATAYQAQHTQSLAAALQLNEYHFLHLAMTMAIVRLAKSEFVLRFPSALTAVLALPAVYALGRHLLGRGTGLAAALLLAISPFVLGYAQEARVYAMYEALACLSLLLLVLALAHRRWYWWAGFVLGTTLLLYAHFFAWIVVAAEVSFAVTLLLWQTVKQRKLDPGLLWLGASLLIVAGLYLPLVEPLLDFMQRYGLGAGTGQAAGLNTFRLSPLFFRNLVVVYGPRVYGWQEYLFGASLVMGLLSAVLRKRWQAFWLILFWFAVPLGFLAVVPSAHFFDHRYLIFFVPIFLLLTAAGISQIARLMVRIAGRRYSSKWHLITAVGLAALLFIPADLPGLRAHYAWEKENWRGIGTFIHDNLMADEVIYVTPPYWAKPLQFYQPSLDPVLILGSETDLQQLQEAAAQHAGLWYIRYAAPFADPTGALTAWVVDQHFDLLIDSAACGYGIYVYYGRFDDLSVDRQAGLLHKAASFCPSDPRFQPSSP
jgi:mannosyltransferase